MRCAPIIALAASVAALPGSATGSESIFATRLHLLNAGARALERGDAVDGVRWTEAALAQPLSVRDHAAAHSNLCAGYVLLKYFERAVEHCNRAEELDPSNWRIYNNRAAAFLGKGLLDQAISDLRRGLAIHPWAIVLGRSLAIALERKRLGMSAPLWPEEDI